MTVFWKLISDIKSIIFLVLLFFYLWLLRIKYSNIWNWKIDLRKTEEAVNSSVNVGWLQLISLQVYNCFNNAHNFFKLLPTRFYNCPLLPPIINNLAGELLPT
jgi:hypothetical protein